jgi:hypothetical protein
MPTHDIIDNRTEKLVDHLNQILGTSERARFAVGFLREDEVSGVTRLLDDVKFKDRDFGSTFCAGTVMMPNHTSLLTPLAFMNT